MSKTLGLSNKPGTELKNVVGFDAQKVYTFADAKKSDLEGDATNRPHLVYDQDLCLAFSQYVSLEKKSDKNIHINRFELIQLKSFFTQNGGAVFNSNVFTHAKPEQQKKFVQVVSRRIAKGAIKQRVSETCSCQLLHGIFSVPKCTVTGQA